MGKEKLESESGDFMEVTFVESRATLLLVIVKLNHRQNHVAKKLDNK